MCSTQLSLAGVLKADIILVQEPWVSLDGKNRFNAHSGYDATFQSIAGTAPELGHGGTFVPRGKVCLVAYELASAGGDVFSTHVAWLSAELRSRGLHLARLTSVYPLNIKDTSLLDARREFGSPTSQTLPILTTCQETQAKNGI